jgi:hypothetical protein
MIRTTDRSLGYGVEGALQGPLTRGLKPPRYVHSGESPGDGFKTRSAGLQPCFRQPEGLRYRF